MRISLVICQGAPNTTRCIKTAYRWRALRERFPVREHPAPPGALRQQSIIVRQDILVQVREHPAPSGALRSDYPAEYAADNAPGQGAPSTIRRVQDLVPEGQVVVLGPSTKGRRPAGAAVAPRPVAPSAALRLPFAVRCAHKGPELGNAVRTQGQNQAVVRGVVLRNSIPCARNRDLRTKEEPPVLPDASGREPETLGPGSRPTPTMCRRSALRCYDSGVPGLSGGPGWMLPGGGRGCLSH